MAWSAAQYLKFEDERTRPARDLLAQIPNGTIRTGVDLGCGPGNSTELVAARFAGAAISGVDSDDDMLASAARRLPHLSFEKADLGTWTPAAPVDLMFANAVFQWIPDHLAVLVRLLGHLAPGGTLAVQMPDNLSEPTHLAMEEVARSPGFARYFEGKVIRRQGLPSPRTYVEALGPASRHVEIWHTVYYHQLANAEAIVEWVKGTGLRPYLNALPGKAQADYLAAYLEKIRHLYPAMDNGKVLLTFPRLFLVAVAS